MLQRRMRRHLTSATFIAAVIDGFESVLSCEAQVKGIMSPLIEAGVWGIPALWIVREPGVSEGGIIRTALTLAAVDARPVPPWSRLGA
jgi:hypothetical protein